jgi:hypothetical protein
MRRLLLQAITTVQAGGDPPAADSSYYRLRAVERIIPEGTEWRNQMLGAMYQSAEAERELTVVG